MIIKIIVIVIIMMIVILMMMMMKKDNTNEEQTKEVSQIIHRDNAKKFKKLLGWPSSPQEWPGVRVLSLCIDFVYAWSFQISRKKGSFF